MNRIAKRLSPSIHRNLEDCPECNYHLFTLRREDNYIVILKCWNCDTEFKLSRPATKKDPVLVLLSADRSK